LTEIGINGGTEEPSNRRKRLVATIQSPPRAGTTGAAAFLIAPPRRIEEKSKMFTEEDSAAGYAKATDGCRCLDRATQDDARYEQRVKPDEESHVLSELDFEEGATWDYLALTTPELVRRTDSIGIQSPVLFGPPIGKTRAAAM
jgi:hypothetical protein